MRTSLRLIVLYGSDDLRLGWRFGSGLGDCDTKIIKNIAQGNLAVCLQYHRTYSIRMRFTSSVGITQDNSMQSKRQSSLEHRPMKKACYSVEAIEEGFCASASKVRLERNLCQRLAEVKQLARSQRLELVGANTETSRSDLDP